MKAKKLPVEIEFFPCELEYLDDIMKWDSPERPIWYTSMDWINWTDPYFLMTITTLEWVHKATPLDMIIKWVNWEVYPCKKDIFEKTYEIIK